MNISNKTT